MHLSDPAQLKVEAARLIVSSGRTLIAEITLNRPRMVLGRDDSCDISLDSRYVSRYQNLFMETPEGWLLLDLGSTNGCFVNGRRVREHQLRDGDLIAVGHHQLRFAGAGNTVRTGAYQRPGPLKDAEPSGTFESHRTDTTLIAPKPAAARSQ